MKPLGSPPLGSFGAVLLAVLVAVLASPLAHAADTPDTSAQTARVGVPLLSTHSSAANFLTPRFQRLLKAGQDRSTKAQTAVFLASEQGTLAALNPRNGEIVWRRVINGTDEIQGFYMENDVELALTGTGHASRATLFQGLTGAPLWSVQLDRKGREFAGAIPDFAKPGSDAAFLPASAASADAVVLSAASRVQRYNIGNGGAVWDWTLPLSDDEDPAKSPALVRVHAAADSIYALALTPTTSVGILSTRPALALSIYRLSASNGTLISKADLTSSLSLPHSLEGYGDRATGGGAADVALVGLEEVRGASPHVLWLQKDGTLAARQLAGETAEVLTLSAKASKFAAIREVGLGSRGFVAAIRADGKGEIAKLEVKKGKVVLKSLWEYEEEAYDAVYSGTRDRSGNAYINRVFFSSHQKLLNFHTLWTDAHEGEGQVTGFSFQYDHDLHGDVLAAPFEASPVGQYQLVTRAVFITSSGSIRLVQEDRHHWMREEGLSKTQAAVLVDLPESRSGSGSSSVALAIADGETFARRLSRHLLALQDAPAFIAATLLNLPDKLSDLSALYSAPKKPAAGKPAASPVPTTTAKRFPAGGVAAAEVKYKQPPPGMPPLNQQRRGSRTGATVDPNASPPSAANRTASAETLAKLHRDKYGFRKVLVSATEAGKLYAQDSLTRDFIWEKSLVGFGEGEGKPNPRVEVKLLSVTRPLGTSITGDAADAAAAAHLGQLLTVIAEVTVDEITVTRAWTLDPLSGEFVGGDAAQTGVALWPSKAGDVFLLPIEDDMTRQRVVGAIVGEGSPQLVLYPNSEQASRAFAAIADSFYFALNETIPGESPVNGLVGYRQDGGVGASSRPIWQIAFGPGESLYALERSASDLVASEGKVLGNRKTLYKYLSPNTLVAVTRHAALRIATVYVVDTVRGEVLHEARIADGDFDDESDVQTAFSENWLVVTFRAKRAGAEEAETRLVSVELYHGEDEEPSRSLFSRGPKITARSSFDDRSASSPVSVYSQTFTLAYGVRALGITRTKFSVASRNLVIATTSGTLLSLPRRILDPRRPVGRKPTSDEMEEGLSTFDAHIPNIPRFNVGGNFVVERLKHIVSAPTLLESTSIVLAHGLDSYVAKVQPSGTFDALPPTFNKVQLLLITAALAIGYVVTRPMLAAKALNARWQ